MKRASRKTGWAGRWVNTTVSAAAIKTAMRATMMPSSAKRPKVGGKTGVPQQAVAAFVSDISTPVTAPAMSPNSQQILMLIKDSLSVD
jgi:hypothetical protein